MQYSLGNYRKLVNNYLFETDESNNIHIYKKGTMKYLDMIEVNFNCNYDEFIFRCNEWIENNC